MYQWTMRHIYHILLVFLGVGSVFGCTNGGKKKAVGCLATYFSKTGQRVPPALRAIISEATGTGSAGPGTSHTQDGGGSSYDYNENLQGGHGLKDEWCGPFQDFQKCLKQAQDKCPGAAVYACVLKSSFATTYGDNICNVDTSSWVKDDLNQCKDVAGATSGGQSNSLCLSNKSRCCSFVVLLLSVFYRYMWISCS